MAITQTCRTCGGDNVSQFVRTGTPLSDEKRSVALARELNVTEEQCERLGCRVKELEQAIKAFCTGTVKVDVLRKVVGAESY